YPGASGSVVRAGSLGGVCTGLGGTYPGASGSVVRGASGAASAKAAAPGAKGSVVRGASGAASAKAARSGAKPRASGRVRLGGRGSVAFGAGRLGIGSVFSGSGLADGPRGGPPTG